MKKHYTKAQKNRIIICTSKLLATLLASLGLIVFGMICIWANITKTMIFQNDVMNLVFVAYGLISGAAMLVIGITSMCEGIIEKLVK